MKAINLMGMKYTEDMINIIKKYDKHMKYTVAKIATENNNSISIKDVHKEIYAYLGSLEYEEKYIITHFIEAGTLLNKKHPITGVICSALLIALTCFINTFALKMIVSVLVAGKLTVELRTLNDKYTYNKIMRIVKKGEI